jgi:ABC-2 type transport system ATP-binding protein
VELRRDLWEYVRALQAGGTTIVLTTHYLEEAEALADRIGMIDRGQILLVEEKKALMQRLGQKTLRLLLTSPANAVPPALQARGARLLNEGYVIELTQPGDADLGPVLAEVLAGGLHVRDVETRRTALEDIYVNLLAAHGEARK